MRHLILVLALWCLLSPAHGQMAVTAASPRNITVDHHGNRFLMDGQPFQYIAGSVHYFRAVPESWRRLIRLAKAAGLNAISTYVEWSLHNPRDHEYVWTGIADLELFLTICAEEDMYVLLRPGPYICAERDFGGFPVWLMDKYPSMGLRTDDSDFLYEVAQWYSVLMPRMQKHLYGRGGNIILVQVENEYGSFGCNDLYMDRIKEMTYQYVQNDALLYTADGITEEMLKCGHANGTVQTVNFGTNTDPQAKFRNLRKCYPKGPLVNSEFYPGWLSHWQDYYPAVAAERVAETLDKMLRKKVNVNFYMFFGGTNFGFTSGANLDPNYRPQTTSYDYNAPVTEAGDVTPKYWAIRNVTSMYVTITTPVPPNPPKLSLPWPITMVPSAELLDATMRDRLCRSVAHSCPLTFEYFNQKGGFVIYEATLPGLVLTDPVTLNVKEVRDRALVYVDRHYVGILSREMGVTNVSFSPNHGELLQLVVEDQGRVNYVALDVWKGLHRVTINGQKISHWQSVSCPLDVAQNVIDAVVKNRKPIVMNRGPTFYLGTFTLSADQVLDTFLNLSKWGKGVAFLNGHNLGRYWSTVRPQRTLYVPKEFLKTGENVLVLLELQLHAAHRVVSLIGYPLLF